MNPISGLEGSEHQIPSLPTTLPEDWSTMTKSSLPLQGPVIMLSKYFFDCSISVCGAVDLITLSDDEHFEEMGKRAGGTNISLHPHR